MLRIWEKKKDTGIFPVEAVCFKNRSFETQRTSENISQEQASSFLKRKKGGIVSIRLIS
jgi:hypothetical protein